MSIQGWIDQMRAQLRQAHGPEFHPPPLQPPLPGSAHDFGHHDLCGPDCTEAADQPSEEST